MHNLHIFHYKECSVYFSGGIVYGFYFEREFCVMRWALVSDLKQLMIFFFFLMVQIQTMRILKRPLTKSENEGFPLLFVLHLCLSFLVFLFIPDVRSLIPFSLFFVDALRLRIPLAQWQQTYKLSNSLFCNTQRTGFYDSMCNSNFYLMLKGKGVLLNLLKEMFVESFPS